MMIQRVNCKEGDDLLVSENTQKALTELVGKCFEMNRFLDRWCSIVNVKFAYNNTADLVHHYISHWAPVLADEITSRCLERYNIPVYYPATPSGGRDYSSVSEAIKNMKEYITNFQIIFMGVCKIANDNNDIHVYADLLDMLEEVNEIVEQAILLSDKIDVYETNPSFDSHVREHFWLLDKED